MEQLSLFLERNMGSKNDYDFNYDYEEDNDVQVGQILCGGFLTTMAIFGIIGNLLSIVVFTRMRKKKVGQNVYLILIGTVSTYIHLIRDFLV